MDSTPRVLKQCADLYKSPKYTEYSRPQNTQATDHNDHKYLDHKYTDHPDVQYFRSVKAKNHYGYHKFKRTPQKHATARTYAASEFDPFSRSLLLQRLTSFSPLNWLVPYPCDAQITELKCSRNGWKGISIAVHNTTKNHLLCTLCAKLLTLRFYEVASDFSMEWRDLQEVNADLAKQYLEQIECSGHDISCPWRQFETPLQGTYYLQPYMELTNEILAHSYLSSLRSLVDNYHVIADKAEVLGHLGDEDSIGKLSSISNSWLVARYYADNKENKIALLSKIPKWVYQVALLGWDLKVQSFAHQLVLFLVCGDCHKKIFLDSSAHPILDKQSQVPTSTGLELSTSKVLTPVKYPAVITHASKSQYDVLEDSDEEELDLYSEHKDWCLRNVTWNDSLRVEDYVQRLVLGVQGIGTNGEYLGSDESMFVDDTSKRRMDFDIGDGLERLNKLRRLYLDD